MTGGRRAAVTGGYLAAVVAVLVARRPDAVLHPQLWAEDGAIWFAGAYNRGASTLLEPHAGYLAILPRSVALLAVAAGLGHAAQLFTAVGLVLQAAPALLILSRRFDRLIPGLWARCGLGLAYLLIPDAEAHANLANAQWHLAVLMLMVLVAAPPRGWAGRAFDVAVILVGGLTAAVGMVLAPLAVVRWSVARTRWSAVLAGGAAATAAVQVVTVLTHPGARGTAPLGAGVRTLVRILADRVVVPAMVGEQNPSLFSAHWWHGLLGATVVVALAAALVAWALRSGSWELRLLLGFGGLALGLALLSPLVAPTGDQWAALLAGDTATRYFLLPTVALWGAVVWGVGRSPVRVRPVLGGVLAVVLVTGVALQLRYPALIDRRPAAQAATLRAAAPGTPVDLPINPAGWHMVLIRR